MCAVAAAYACVYSPLPTAAANDDGVFVAFVLMMAVRWRFWYEADALVHTRDGCRSELQLSAQPRWRVGEER